MNHTTPKGPSNCRSRIEDLQASEHLCTFDWLNLIDTQVGCFPKEHFAAHTNNTTHCPLPLGKAKTTVMVIFVGMLMLAASSRSQLVSGTEVG